MSNETTCVWVGGIGGFIIGALIVGTVCGWCAEGSECRRWERQCISRGVGTYDRTGKWQWNDNKPEKQP